ncbi:MAG TPA: type II restriction endonuclease [Gaiellaceae bacterium]|nr:type II restriction endonuclease [Gaiellaceae bacterium]
MSAQRRPRRIAARFSEPNPVPQLDVLDWLREQCANYVFDVVALYRLHGDHPWPLMAGDEVELERKLEDGAHFLPLPKEPAALANILEVSVVDYLLERVEGTLGLEVARGTERGYPDLELTGSAVGDEFYAVDVKVARRARGGRRTQSRITLYTGNTYFRYPQLRWPGTFRPFESYAQHYTLVCLYDLEPTRHSRVANLELIVHPTWRVASRQRSSTTREYLGAVNDIEALRQGAGEFETPDDFYAFWRRFSFRIGRAVQQQLDRLLAEQRGEER